MTSKYRLIWQLMARERGLYAAAIGALVVASSLLYLVPLVPAALLDGAVSADAPAASPMARGVVALFGGRDYVRSHLWLCIVPIVGLTMASGVFTYLRGRWSAIASENITRLVRDRLYDQLQHLPASYYDTAATGDLVQRCTSDVETLRTFLVTQVVEIGRAVLMLLVPLPLMFAIDVRMTLVSLVLIPPIVAFSVVFFRGVKARFEDVDKAEGRMTSTLQENLAGVRVVRAFGRRDFEIEKFAVRNGEHRRLDYRLYQLLAWFWALSDLLCMGQIALVVFLGGVRLSEGTLGVGGFFFFITVVNMFLWPVRMMGRILTELGKATVAIGRIDEILGHPRESEPAAAGSLAEPAAGREIVFRNVTFSHRAGAPALDDVSFRIRAGETLALAGPSGSGKSTIVNLLLRLYDPDSGTIEIDGQDIRTLHRKEVRRQIAAVLQEPFLYARTIRQNLVLSDSRATHEEIAEAASAACVHGTIQEFEHSYDTLVGERGITLSGGQRQRVAIARALLKPQTIFVLDDALSAVDAATEASILEGLRRRRGRATTIVIAHRLSTLIDADHIVVLDRGRVAQEGTHAQLKDEPGLYGRIWMNESGMEPAAASAE